MWVPLSFGNPEIEKNHPKHFWPGKGYVDWVGTTWYSIYKASSAFHTFYNNPKWRSKPFAFAEWGIWGARRPRLRRPVLRLPQVAPARAHGGLLPVGVAEAGVRAEEPPGQPRRAAARRQVAAPDRRGALTTGSGAGGAQDQDLARHVLEQPLDLGSTKHSFAPPPPACRSARARQRRQRLPLGSPALYPRVDRHARTSPPAGRSARAAGAPFRPHAGARATRATGEGAPSPDRPERASHLRARQPQRGLERRTREGRPRKGKRMRDAGSAP